MIKKLRIREISESITNEQLKEMFDAAKDSITDWTQVSSISKNITKGTAWNMLAANFDVTKAPPSISEKREMITEFGEYLPNEIKYSDSKKQLKHEEPKL